MPLPTAAVVEATIFALLAARRAGATICPSEVARALRPGSASAWHPLMPRIRRVAALLAAHGRLRVTQRGAAVETCRVRGPIRLGGVFAAGGTSASPSTRRR